MHNVIAQLGMLEMEEVSRIVPNEAILINGFAVTSNLFLSFEDKIVVRGGSGIGEAGDTGSND